MRFNTSFSHNFEKKGNKLIGLYDDGRFGGFLAFGIRKMIANFHYVRNMKGG